jgi:hypothetical protein
MTHPDPRPHNPHTVRAQSLLHGVGIGTGHRIGRLMHCLAAVEHLERLNGPVPPSDSDLDADAAIRAALTELGALSDQDFANLEVLEACAHARHALRLG